MALKKQRVFAAVTVAALLVLASGIALADPTDVNNPLGVKFDAGEFINGLVNVLKWVLTLGTIVVAGGIVYLGFEFVTSAGSPQKRAQVMDGIKNLLIGGVFIFGAFFITSLLQQLANWIFGVAHP